MTYQLKLQGGPLDGLEERYACEGPWPLMLTFPSDMGEPKGPVPRMLVVYAMHGAEGSPDGGLPVLRYRFHRYQTPVNTLI